MFALSVILKMNEDRARSAQARSAGHSAQLARESKDFDSFYEEKLAKISQMRKLTADRITANRKVAT